jgi:tRNA A-37 threonylcarbamoyl transferase component Bud32
MSELAEGSAIGPYPYRIIRRLGHKQGNMADVYLAAIGDILDSSQVNLVVVKITRQDETHGEFFRATLENEVERLRRLKHPGIVRLYPIQREGLRNLPYMAQASLPGRPWFSVMEYLAGDSLAYLLQERRQLDIGAAMEIARSLAATLDYIHNLNQVHLDIKPQNILFREPLQGGKDPQPVLIDFGIARLTGQAGLEAGTLQWLAPERVRFVRGDKPPELMVRPHPSMDIYALGMVLYVMIAGRLPYSERTRKGITTAILDGSPTAPSTYHRMVHKDLDDLVLMALAADPSQRPTADEFARALEELSIRLGYRSHYGHLAPIPAAAARAVSSGGRSRAKLAAVALGGLVLVQSLALGALALPRLTDDPTGLTPTPVAPTDQTPTPAGTEGPHAAAGPDHGHGCTGCAHDRFSGGANRAACRSGHPSAHSHAEADFYLPSHPHADPHPHAGPRDAGCNARRPSRGHPSAAERIRADCGLGWSGQRQHGARPADLLLAVERRAAAGSGLRGGDL